MVEYKYKASNGSIASNEAISFKHWSNIRSWDANLSNIHKSEFVRVIRVILFAYNVGKVTR